jgi:hypothetical protein
MLGRRAAVFCLGVCAALGPAAGAKAGTITLLSPITRFKPPPPLSGTTPFEAGAQETRFPGQLQNDERVVVALEDDGSARGIVVTQRIVISRAGDFSFLIPAPATRVVPTPDSQAQPGLRSLGIVWQGFSSGRRLLGATVTLGVDADRGLPLLVSVARRGGAVRVRLLDIARRTTEVPTGSPAPGSLRSFLVGLRAAQSKVGQRPAVGAFVVSGTATGHATVVVSAPLRIRGALTVPGRAPVEVDTLLGNGRPLARTITLPGRVLPKIRLRVDLLDPLEILPRPDELDAARDPLSTLQSALGSVAVSWQYRHFLDLPDWIGPTSTTYLFRTAIGGPIVTPVPDERRSGGSGTLAVVLASTLGAAALAGLVVLWAHM